MCSLAIHTANLALLVVPMVAQVAVKRRPALIVFGDDYATPDGTGVRDYIHVMDLAEGHVAALRLLERMRRDAVEAAGPGGNQSNGAVGVTAGGASTGSNLVMFNLGSGLGHSVLEMVAAMEAACGCAVPVVVADRRPGDLATVLAATDKAAAKLGWRATRCMGAAGRGCGRVRARVDRVKRSFGPALPAPLALSQVSRGHVR